MTTGSSILFGLSLATEILLALVKKTLHNQFLAALSARNIVKGEPHEENNVYRTHSFGRMCSGAYLLARSSRERRHTAIGRNENDAFAHGYTDARPQHAQPGRVRLRAPGCVIDRGQ